MRSNVELNNNVSITVPIKLFCITYYSNNLPWQLGGSEASDPSNDLQ